jgi:indolepyruvate ferredoxin oxidoreductase alpha subunit
VAVADDQGQHSSQNEQDSRQYAIAAKVPMLEPCDSQECKDYTKLCYEISETYDTPVILRLSTRVSHSRSPVELLDPILYEKKEYKKDTTKYVMVPGNAKGRRVVVEERLKKLLTYSEESGINRIINPGKRVGIIAAGSAYVYAREALGDMVSYLKLGMVNPLPIDLIHRFAKSADTVYVIEELDPVIENHCKVLGIKVIGKELFPTIGEFNQEIIREKVMEVKSERKIFRDPIPQRPPVMCPGCPHRGLFTALKKLKISFVCGDIGCYSLAFAPPIAMMDTLVCMGASVSGIHGYNLANGRESAKKSVAVLGDSTFTHSGITGLIDIVYNQTDSKVIILDNSTTSMTGQQENPVTGVTLKGEPSTAINLEALARSLGIVHVAVVDPYDITRTTDILRSEMEKDGPGIIISRRPCALLKTSTHYPSLAIDPNACVRCGACLTIGCPCISCQEDKSVHIDPNQCVGCNECTHMCKFGAIRTTAMGGEVDS